MSLLGIDGKRVGIEIDDNGNLIIIRNPHGKADVCIRGVSLSDIDEKHWNGITVKNGFKYNGLGKVCITKNTFGFSGVKKFTMRITEDTKITHSVCSIGDANIKVFVLHNKGDRTLVAFNPDKSYIRTTYTNWKKIISSPTKKSNGILHYRAKPENEVPILERDSNSITLKNNIALYVLEHDMLSIAMRFDDIIYFTRLTPERLDVYFEDKEFSFVDGDIIGNIEYKHKPPVAIDVGIMRGALESPREVWLTQVLSYFRLVFPLLAGIPAKDPLRELYN